MTRIPAYFIGAFLAAGSVLSLIRRVGWTADGEVRRQRWIRGDRQLRASRHEIVRGR